MNNNRYKCLWQNGNTGALKLLDNEVKPDGEWYLVAVFSGNDEGDSGAYQYGTEDQLAKLLSN